MTVSRYQGHISIVARDSRSAAALAAVAAQGGATVSQFADRQDCLHHLWAKPCGVLVADLEKDAALETVAHARRIWPWQPCIVLVRRGAVSHAVEMVKAGAADCLEKPVSARRLRSAIEHELSFVATLFNSRVPLTRTELKVLHLILAGRIARDIARHLGRSKRTIDVHRNHIFRKVGAKNCVDVVKWAMSMGFLGDESSRPPLGMRPARSPILPRRHHSLPASSCTT